jgi:uncharacterized protein YbjT (DUF2867 family)
MMLNNKAWLNEVQENDIWSEWPGQWRDNMSSRTAAVLGASGLVGGFCLRTLVDDSDYTRVLTFGRREMPPLTRAKVTQRIADLGSLNAEDFRGVQDVFSALGTTIRKAGSQAAFRVVDLELPLRAAQEACKAGAEQFVVVSSVGADARSKNFYLRTKGELEEELSKLPFRAIHILRPSLLIGRRQEFRLGESVAMKIAPALDLITIGPLRKYHSMRAEMAGRAMVGAARQQTSGTMVYEYDGIVNLAA